MDSDKLLRSYIDRVMRLHEERKGLSDDISEIYKEAKSKGFDRKALVNTVKRLSGDESAFAELDQLTDLYLRTYRGTGLALTHAPAPALTSEMARDGAPAERHNTVTPAATQTVPGPVRTETQTSAEAPLPAEDHVLGGQAEEGPTNFEDPYVGLEIPEKFRRAQPMGDA